MNWNDLKVLLAIADSGSLSGAAKTLGVNHSTIFRRLNALEQDMSARLFDRLPTGYVITPVGERMLELARQADDAIQVINRELAGRDLAPTGTVRITTAPNIARIIVPRAALNLRRSFPNIVLEVSVGDDDYDLSRRQADIALRATTRPPEHLIGRKVLELYWSVCGADAIQDQWPESLNGLDQVPLIGADSSMMRISAFQWLEERYKDNIVCRANDLSTMAALTKAGVGFSLLPSDQNEPGLREALRIPDLRGQLWLLAHPDLKSLRRVSVVWDALAEAALHSGNEIGIG